MLFRASALMGALLLAAPAQAQDCSPADPPMGQPSLAGIRPVCLNAVDLATLHASGNPAFEIAPAYPASLPDGHPLALAFYFSPAGLVNAPSTFFYCYGERPLLPPLGLGNFVLVFAGFLGPAPLSLPIPIVNPLPPGFSALVNTIGIDLRTYCIFATDGIMVKS